MLSYKYILKAETEIITDIAASPIRRAVILITMYVKLTDNYQYQYKFVDT